MPDYHSTFKRGEKVRIKDSQYLEEFQKTWGYHHNISDDQIKQGGKPDTVNSIEYYHGGEVLIGLENVPGVWHEELLEEWTPRTIHFVPASQYYDIHPESEELLSWIIVQGKKGETYRVRPEYAETAEMMREVAKMRTKEGFEFRYRLPPITDEKWLENKLPQSLRREYNATVAVLVVSIATIFLIVFFVYGTSLSLLIMFVLIGALVLVRVGTSWSIHGIRLSKTGFRVRYRYQKSEDFFPWNLVRRIETRWKLSSNVIRYTYVNRITDRDGRNMVRKRMAMSDDLLQAFRNYSRTMNPNMEWIHVKPK